MNSTKKTIISVHTLIHAPIVKVWKNWTTPEDICRWNNASDDWHTPRAENDIRIGGRFLYRMEARDGSFGFDFEGVYDSIIMNEYIAYHMADERKVRIVFTSIANETKVFESFEAEDTNSIDLQRAGWQAILENFKKYTEARQ